MRVQGAEVHEAARLTGVAVLEHLDEGAMGEVWRGRSTVTGAPVAVKIVRSDLDDLRAIERFEAEIRVVAGLSHPNVVCVLDVGRTPADGRWAPGTPYLVMEYLSGGTLAGLRGASWPTLRRALVELLHGLGAAHADGVVHRDLKPANVLLGTAADARPGLKLCDFGVASLMGERTRSAGSLAYMAPEQLTGGPVGPWSDLYAVGGVAYALLTGRHPLSTQNPRQAVADKLAGPLVLPDHVPDELAAWIHDLTAPSWRARPHHVEQALDGLRRMSAEGVTVGPTRERAATATFVFSTRFDGDVAAVPELGADSDGRVAPVLQLPARPVSMPLAPPPRLLAGAGLGLLRLRRPSLRGRGAAQAQLWSWLRAPASSLSLAGPRGGGARSLARWLVGACRRAGGTAVWWREGSLAATLAPWWPEDDPDERVVRAQAVGPVLVVVDGDPASPVPDGVHLLRVGARDGEALWLAPLEDGVVADVLADHAPLAPWFARCLARQAEGSPGRAVRQLVSDAEAGRLRWCDDGWCPADPAPVEAVLSSPPPRAGSVDASLLDVVLRCRRGDERGVAALQAVVERVRQEGHRLRGVIGVVWQSGCLGGLGDALGRVVDGWLRVEDARLLRLGGDPRADRRLRRVVATAVGRVRALAQLERVRLSDMARGGDDVGPLVADARRCLLAPRTPAEVVGIGMTDAEIVGWLDYNEALCAGRGHPAALVVSMERVAEEAARVGARRLEADACAELAVALGHEEAGRAVTWARRAIARNRDIGRWSGVADATSTLGHCLSSAGELEEALEAFGEAAAAYRALGSSFEVYAQLGAAVANVRLGRAESARDHLAAALPLAASAGSGVHGYALRVYAAVCFVSGDDAGSRRWSAAAARVDPHPLAETRDLRRNLLEAYDGATAGAFWAQIDEGGG